MFASSFSFGTEKLMISKPPFGNDDGTTLTCAPATPAEISTVTAVDGRADPVPRMSRFAAWHAASRSGGDPEFPRQSQVRSVRSWPEGATSKVRVDRGRRRGHRQLDAVLLGEAPGLDQDGHGRLVGQRDLLHVDGDRDRVLLRQRQELVAELAGTRAVDLADDADRHPTVRA